jgi:hypothetical protein
MGMKILKLILGFNLSFIYIYMYGQEYIMYCFHFPLGLLDFILSNIVHIIFIFIFSAVVENL